MKGDILRSKILSEKIIPNMNEQYRKQFPIPEGHRSLGIFTADCDDVCYIGMDEASKSTDIQIVHATALYAGAANASFKLSGEFYGAFSAPNPEDIVSAFKIIHHVVENDAYFVSCNEDDSIAYISHVISRSGTYWPQISTVKEGEALLYVIAPPNESMYAMDAALKAAEVEVAAFWAPPTYTNCGGGILKGEQSACRAAGEAFAKAVQYVADHPLQQLPGGDLSGGIR
ncbi:ethanolamine utilization microcompartment protein EutL [bacterium 210917-DFI.7.65]|nr:ethanolamine utilization microcompartment protein EutL [Clostridiales bacterium]MCB6899557.1 ethanolamine utilization microcompartment protein EutL [bacterium 210917-DFI.7.65]